MNQSRQLPTEQKRQRVELERAIVMERQAQELRASGEIQKAFETYDQAAKLYQKLGSSLKASICFATAATCWDVHTGWQPLENSASRNYLAGLEAIKAKHYDYAISLFRNAALQYEKEGDSENSSRCFIETQHARRKKAWSIAFGGQKDRPEMIYVKIDWRIKLKSILEVITNFISEGFWGYGEKPFRTLLVAAVVISSSAMFYLSFGEILVRGQSQEISFYDAFYYSVITFTTLGYGDYAPVGFARLVAMFEVLCGVMIVPLFLVGLTRKFLANR